MIPPLLETPAALRFVSAEPLLGYVDLTNLVEPPRFDCLDRDYLSQDKTASIDWVICGCESGLRRRPFDEDWARSLRDQCQAAAVPFFYKQGPGPGPRSVDDTPELDGRTWTEFPRANASVAGNKTDD